MAINDQKLYTFDGSAYVEALDSVFYDTNTIWLSEDEERIIVLTSEEFTTDTAFKFAVRYYVKDG